MRPEIAEARRLRAAGLDYLQIADRLGSSKSTVYRWCNPSSAESQRVAARAWKQANKLECRECGDPVNVSDGLDVERTGLCAPCFGRELHETRRWTPETIIEAIQRWAREHDGQAPTATQWQAAGENHPCEQTVHRELGGWSNAIEAAGFPVRHRSRTTGVSTDVLVVMHAAGATQAYMAEVAGCSPTNISQRLLRRGIRSFDHSGAVERREAVLAGYSAGESPTAIAKRLDVPVNTVYSIAWRARRAGEDLPDRRYAA